VPQKSGNRYGTHRVLEPGGAMPQPATRVDNDFSTLYDNEILCDVSRLNIDAASFAVIKDKAERDPKRVAAIMLDIVRESGKHKNPWTGSGGMFIGRVAQLGEALRGRIPLAPGDPIASLVSLSLTPLRIDEILAIHLDRDQVEIRGQAVLFESGIWAKLPADIPEPLALAVLDVAGAPAQVDRLVHPGETVAVVGGLGKSGLLCCYQAKKRAGPSGRVIAVDVSTRSLPGNQRPPFIDEILIAKADQALEVLAQVERTTDGRLCDLVISCVSRPDCELGCILATRDRGRVYFFSMTTDFTRAALSAEGVGKDVDMLIGNGYCAGHAELTLGIMRESAYLRDLYTARYCGEG
jgi:L-erythro-3,5-diaminohexanoate dehydrogenase